MIKYFLQTKFYLLSSLLAAFILTGILSFKNPSNKPGTLRITFVNTANGKKISLRDSMYTNAFGEQYNISKLKYYISNFFIPGSEQLPENDPYHLMNAADSNH